MSRLILFAIRGYRRLISPFLPSSCRFSPTCSHYAQQAFERYGAIKGSRLTIKRIVKCHPYHPGGFDPLQ